MKAAKRMKFHRYGSAHHLCIETADDLEFAVELDEALWVATSAPSDGINCDLRLRQLLDVDGAGRITSRELKNAITWLLDALKDRRGIDASSEEISLDAINADSEAGRVVLQAAEKMFARLGLKAADTISLAEIRRIKAEVEARPVSEAGVVLPEASEDPEIGQFLADAVAVTAGSPHPSGAMGIGKAQLAEFISAVVDQQQWREAGQLAPDGEPTEVMPLGSDTQAAFELLSEFRGKIDQYFAQCEAAALDERFVQRMGWTEQELGDLDFDDPNVIELVLRKAPLARARPERTLTFDQSVNPYYVERLEQFGRMIAEPILGHAVATLSAGQWAQIKATFAAHEAWQASQGSPALQALDDEKLAAYRQGRFAKAGESLIADSTEAAFELDNIRMLEKLLLFQTGLIDLANNFVSFPHLYDPTRRAMFEMGTLVTDGRRFNLAVRVEDRHRHVELAKGSSMFVLYVEVSPGGDAKPYEVAVPVTSGGRGNLRPSKRGVFYDINGLECDARIVHIIENPISLWEAMASPFKRLGRLITGKIESLTAQAEKKLDSRASSAMSIAPGKQASPAAAPSRLATGGMLMGAGVAVAVLGSAVAYIIKTLAGLSVWTIVAAIGGAALLVALPTSIVAFMKLRKRDLSAILEGSGWAINARMRLTRPQRRYFSQRPDYPANADGVRRAGHLAYYVIAAVLVLLVIVYVIGGANSSKKPTQPPSPPASQPAQVK